MVVQAFGAFGLLSHSFKGHAAAGTYAGLASRPTTKQLL